MKYTPHIYATVLESVLEKTPEDKIVNIIKNFITVLNKNGDRSYFNKVIEILEGMLVRKEGGKNVVIEMARELGKVELDLLKNEFGHHDKISFKLNPSLIAGVRVTVNGNRELDQSLERRLSRIFK